jgi:hypothetical protein
LSLKTAKKEKQDELKATGSSKSYPMLWVKWGSNFGHNEDISTFFCFLFNLRARCQVWFINFSIIYYRLIRSGWSQESTVILTSRELMSLRENVHCFLPLSNAGYMSASKNSQMQ